MKQFNLPKYVKGKSFAEASKFIAKKFKDRNDPESIATLNELQGRLKQAQEFVKQQQEARTKPQGNNSFKLGGDTDPQQSMLNNRGAILQGQVDQAGLTGQTGSASITGGVVDGASSPNTGGPSAEGGGGAGLAGMLKGKAGAGTSKGGAGVAGYLGAATTALDLGQTAFGDTGIDTSGRSEGPEVGSNGGAMAGGAMKGAQAGSAFGGWGMAAGAVIGGAAGFLGNKKKKKDAAKANINFAYKQRNESVNAYDGGGPLSGDGDGDNDDRPRVKSVGGTELSGYDMDGLDLNKKVSPLAPRYEKNLSKWDMIKGKAGEAVANNKDALRYAPAAMNAFQLAKLKKPKDIALNKLNTKYKKQLVDEKGMQNTVGEATDNIRNAILSSSGGSGSTARANLLASQLQGTKAMSDAYQKSGAENRQEGRTAQAFDKATDQFNIGQSNNEKNINMTREAAYDTNKSKLMAALGDDLGSIGTEELYKKYPELMDLNYDWKGEHIPSRKRKKKSKKKKDYSE